MVTTIFQIPVKITFQQVSVSFLLPSEVNLKNTKQNKDSKPYEKPGTAVIISTPPPVLFQAPVQRIKSIMCNSLKRSCSNLRSLRPENSVACGKLRGTPDA